MKRRAIYPILLLFIILIPAYSAAKMRIVVMNLKADGVPDRTARTVSNMLRTEFINIGKFTVVERAQMDAILQEQGMQKTGCTDQECAVQLGKLMSARKIMVGEVSPMGKTIIMTVRIVDVEKGVSEFAATQKALSEDVLDTAVTKIARKIARRIEGQPVSAPVVAEKKEKAPEKPGEKTMLGYYLRGIVPGWGQFYAGRNIKGWVFLGTFTASTVLAILAISNYNTKKKEYDDLGPSASESEFDKKYKEYEDAGTSAKVLLGFFGVVYLINWVDIIFFSRPDFGSKVGVLNYDNCYVTFNAYKPWPNKNEKQIDFGLGMRF